MALHIGHMNYVRRKYITPDTRNVMMYDTWYHKMHIFMCVNRCLQAQSDVQTWCVFIVSLVYIGCSAAFVLTHWVRVTHICVGKLNIIGLDKGLSPGRRQAIIWTNLNKTLIEFKHFNSRKCTWKWRLWNGVHLSRLQCVNLNSNILFKMKSTIQT